jgi:hypothetical protein
VKYVYTAIFSIKGLSMHPSAGDELLLVDPAAGIRAILTSQPDPHSLEGDRALAVAGLMLQGIVSSKCVAKEFKLRVTDAVAEIKAARQKEFGTRPFLVVIGEGEAASFTPSQQRDAEDFIVCFDAADKDEIRGRFHHNITAIMNAISFEAVSVIGISKVTDAVVFFQEDGKPIYSYTFSGGAAKMYISRPLADGQVDAIAQLYRPFAADITLQRVQRLIRFSFETEDDLLRSFLAAWSAFEIFVNKVFATYETAFFDSVAGPGDPEALRKYLARIREVMKDKYRLLDKFAAISFQLSPDTANVDLETARVAKEVRDHLLHGEHADEASLPVKSIRDLASKYVRLHITSRQVV